MRLRLTIAYDGSSFRGFAANQGVRTVAATLASAIERVLGHGVVLTCAGRTDAGVHAWGQVVSFDAQGPDVDPADLARSLNSLCGPEVVVRAAEVAPQGFDARRCARARSYRYLVLNRPVPDPFLAATSWWVESPLDLVALRQAADPFIGEHDFTSFCRRPKVGVGAEAVSLVRRVTDASWHDLGEGMLRFDIAAGAFCHQMVRAVVGTLVEVGIGRRQAGEMLAILTARDRARAGQLAPPQGLCLWAVDYPPDDPAVAGTRQAVPA